MTINNPQLKPNGFTFKRFFVAHDNSPMKITTDSVLLAAWLPLSAKPQRILDLGTGCGVIALMLAQRLEETHCIIDAIDIDTKAVQQCRENIALSPFSSVTALCDDIIHYAAQHKSKYDLIVSNPPYFETAVDCRNSQRQTARYTSSLNHTQLLTCAETLLTEHGQLALVLPWLVASKFEQLAIQLGWFTSLFTHVKYSVNKEYSLALLVLSKQSVTKQENELCMRNQDNSYTEQFAELLKDFYLRF